MNNFHASGSKISPKNEHDKQGAFSYLSHTRKESNVHSDDVATCSRRTDVGLKSEQGNQCQVYQANLNLSQFCQNKFGQPYKRVKLENGLDKIIDNQTCACKSVPKIPVLKPNVLKGQSQVQSPEQSERLNKLSNPLSIFLALKQQNLKLENTNIYDDYKSSLPSMQSSDQKNLIQQIRKPIAPAEAHGALQKALSLGGLPMNQNQQASSVCMSQVLDKLSLLNQQ